MSEYVGASQRIFEAFKVGANTIHKDWEIIFKELIGGSDEETIRNVQKFILENFSFEIEAGSEGFAYFGRSGETIGSADTPIYKYVEALVEASPKKYGYISSTQAGKLFNDDAFTSELSNIVSEDINKILFNGKNSSGYIYDGVQSMNDFFSENYIMNLKEPNLDTLLSGDYTLNCFGRTEFKAIMKNDAIKSINGVNKEIFGKMLNELTECSLEKEAMSYVCDAIKASELKSISDIYFKISISDAKKTVVNIVSKETEGAISLVDTMLINNKVSTSSLNELIAKYGTGISTEVKDMISKLSTESDSFLFNKCLEQGKSLTELAGKDVIKIGSYEISATGEVVETLQNGSKVMVNKATSTTAEELIENGWKKTLIGEEEYWIKSDNRGVTKITALKGILTGVVASFILVDAGKEFYDAFEKYQNGDYKTGSTNLIKYGTSSLGMLAGSSLLSMLAGVAGVTITGPIGLGVALIGGLFGALTGDCIGDAFSEWICDLLGYTDSDYASAGSAIKHVADPLVIDMDGDGFELLSVEDGVYFDENNAGLKEKTQWVAPDDALLAIDLNGDGIIGDGSELFGTSTVLKNGTHAKTGFEALAQYDENGDGIIDEMDEIYSKLLIWSDKSSDGISQREELQTLQEAGIKSISLKASEKDSVNVADIALEDGSTTKIGEFTFDVKLFDSVEKEKVDISAEISKLPNVKAIGNVASLHTLMQMDNTGALKGYVTKFMQSSSTKEKEALTTQILYMITGASKVDSDCRGDQFDAQKLEVIETFMGKEFVGTAGSNPVNAAATMLGEVYNDIFEIYYNILNGETALKGYLNMTLWITDENGNRYLDTSFFDSYVESRIDAGIDMKNIVVDMGKYIHSINGTNSKNFINYVAGYADKKDYFSELTNMNSLNFVVGTDGVDTINLKNIDSYVFGLDGDDIVNGGSKDDLIYGGSGNDTINGGEGNDTIHGGKGDDTLSGSCGVDTYVFNVGDGKDVIDNFDHYNWKNDKIQFEEGISEGDIELTRSKIDLIITNVKSGDKITVKSAFNSNNESQYIGSIEFANGTVWNREELINRTQKIRGTEGNDTLIGYESGYNYNKGEVFEAGAGDDIVNAGYGDDVIYGGSGNDTINGDVGNDTIYGGEGNDALLGGSGADTYVFEVGDGEDIIDNFDHYNWKNDKIQFEEGISEGDIELTRSKIDLIITNVKSGDKITVKSAFNSNNESQYIGSLEFANGTVWNQEELFNRTQKIRGTEGNDTLIGYESGYNYNKGEVFEAGAGDDIVNAGYGDDVIYGGSGNDTINGDVGNDTIYGGEGNDTLLGGSGADTYVFEVGSGQDIIDNFDHYNWKNDKIQFKEGISKEDIELTRSQIDLIITNVKSGDKITVKSAFNSNNESQYIGSIEFANGTVWNQEELFNRTKKIRGTEGNDTLIGYESGYNYNRGEVFEAGAGDDIVNAGYGDDVIYGDIGNDTINAGYGDDAIYGGSGNDTINGDVGSDTIYGEEGNDTLLGGSGADTYVFEVGSGQDIIDNFDHYNWKNDKIQFEEGISEGDIELTRSKIDLIITNVKSGDKITVKSAFYSNNESQYIGSIEFANGTVWNREELINRTQKIRGTEGNDTLIGYESGYNYNKGEVFEAGAGDDIVNAGSGDDVIYGGSGNDTINGDVGNDTIYGGEGNDTLRGDSEADTYVFEVGSGQDIIDNFDHYNWKNDKIQFEEGICEEDIELIHVGNDFIITNVKSGDKITVQNAFYDSNGSHYIGSIEFANGIIWGQEELKERTVNHSENNMDYNYNQAEDDTYNFGIGYASDAIDDIYGNNSIVLNNLQAEDVTFTKEENQDIIMTINDTNEQLTIKNYNSDNYMFEFSDIDYKVMVLTENMAAFQTEATVYDGIAAIPMSELVTGNQQLFVSKK